MGKCWSMRAQCCNTHLSTSRQQTRCVTLLKKLRCFCVHLALYPMLPSLLKPSSNHSTPINPIVVTQVVAMNYSPKGSADSLKI